MISCASCQCALALRLKKQTPEKTRRLTHTQKATWNVSCSLNLFCLVVYPELTAWQERWKDWAHGTVELTDRVKNAPLHELWTSGQTSCPTRALRIWLFGCRSSSTHRQSVCIWQRLQMAAGKGTRPHDCIFPYSPRCKDDGSMVSVSSNRLLGKKSVYIKYK